MALVTEEAEDDGIDPDVVVIIDNGSGMVKAGLSTDEGPTQVFPEVVGRPRPGYAGQLDKPLYVGDQINEHMEKLAVTYPLENGIVENFEYMELLWEYTFVDALKVSPTSHPVLLTEPPFNPKPNREKMVEIMFETFGVPSLNISIQGVLALVGQGRMTGLVLDAGEGVTHTIPVYDGYGLSQGVQRLDLAGRDLNTLLAKYLAQEGHSMTTTVEQYHVRQMKEKHCFVSQDPGAEFAETVNYSIPAHGSKKAREVPLADERWKCPEALFAPNTLGIEAMGVGGLVWESIQKCEIDVRQKLYSNIVLSGGSTTFPGFAERLTKELKMLAPAAAQAHIRVIPTAQNPKFAVWAGAKATAELRSVMQDQWMSIEDYDEYGVTYIHDKIAIRS